jgi:hypothetical protein
MLRLTDAYTIRTRLLPATLGEAPSLAALMLFIPWKGLELLNIVATLAGFCLISDLLT